jgi:Fe-S-cluster containining protein
MPSLLPSGDHDLVQITDAALAEVTRKSGEWLACRKGCTQCCMGPFAINQLDSARLQQGLAELEMDDPRRAARIRERARESMARLAQLPGGFPGDLVTGILDDGEDAERRFDEFTDLAEDEPCPVLDPETGTCDLYSSRPMTCRVFGPPVRSGGGLGVCELCFHGATDEEIAACEMPVDPGGLEPVLLDEIKKATGACGGTIVALCVGGQPSRYLAANERE